MITQTASKTFAAERFFRGRLSFAIGLAVVVSVFTFIFSVQGQASSFTIGPGRQDSTADNNSDWFVYSVKPGEVIEDTLKIQNQTTDISSVNVSVHDIKVTNQGSFAVASEGEDNEEVGSWTSFKQGAYVINPSSFIEIPFKITIPQDTPAGEYAGGITAYSLSDFEGSVNVRVRQGVRIYIMTGEDFAVDTTLKDFGIVNIADQDYLKSLPNADSLGKDNLVVSFLSQYSGTVFASLSAVVSVTFEDGRSIEVPYKSELIPRTSPKPQFVRINTPYDAGRMSARIVYTVTPLNNPDKAQTSGVYEAELTLTKEQLEQASIALNPLVNKPLSESTSKEKPAPKLFLEVLAGVLIAASAFGSYPLTSYILKKQKTREKTPIDPAK